MKNLGIFYEFSFRMSVLEYLMLRSLEAETYDKFARPLEEAYF